MFISWVEIFKNLIFVIPQLFIVIACIILFSKRNSTESVFMFLGSIILIIVNIFHIVIVPLMYSRHMFGNYVGRPLVIQISSSLGLIGGILFAIGLFILVNQVTEKKNTGNFPE